ncbi:MAG: hypothetical protein M3O30_07015 [Planctomycetota bacterium]|nr:hypothetical protein [Planctomycetota bacterium]
MICNIDAKGKRARLAAGLLVGVIGLALIALWASQSGGEFAWMVSASLVAGGGFMIFEARSGWCALRAMGFKTKI